MSNKLNISGIFGISIYSISRVFNLSLFHICRIINISMFSMSGTFSISIKSKIPFRFFLSALHALERAEEEGGVLQQEEVLQA